MAIETEVATIVRQIAAIMTEGIRITVESIAGHIVPVVADIPAVMTNIHTVLMYIPALLTNVAIITTLGLSSSSGAE